MLSSEAFLEFYAEIWEAVETIFDSILQFVDCLVTMVCSFIRRHRKWRQDPLLFLSYVNLFFLGSVFLFLALEICILVLKM